MATRRVNTPKSQASAPRPATTPEEREHQLIALAVDVAEDQLRNGTASAQVVTHFLKLASSREKLEQERMRMEVELLEAKREAMTSAVRVEELYGNAITAMRHYSGQDSDEDDYEG